MTLCWGEGGVSFEEDVFIWKSIGQAQFNPAYRIYDPRTDFEQLQADGRGHGTG